MAGRRRVVVLGETRGRGAVALLCRELDDAIRALGLTYAAVGRDVGLSGAQVGRIAHGRSRDLSIRQASTLLAAVGHELVVRAYPTGRPLRDAPQLTLLEQFRSLLHPAISWRTEVPVMHGGDLRAWDALITGRRWRYGVEAETVVRDVQALDRRIALKRRDGDVRGVVLLVKKTRTNSSAMRSAEVSLRSSFPVPAPIALQRLRAGDSPGGNTLIVL